MRAQESPGWSSEGRPGGSGQAGCPRQGTLFRAAVVVVIVVVKVLVEVIVLLPLLTFGIPPLVDLLVALLALIAKVVRMFAGFFAVSPVVGDRLLPFEFDLLRLFAAFREIVISAEPWSRGDSHKPRDQCGREDRFRFKYEARLTLRKQGFLLNCGGR